MRSDSIHQMLTYASTPEWARCNPYLLYGYRSAPNTWRASLASLFQCHNETCNIWTHLIGLFGFSLLWAFTMVWVQPQYLPRWPLTLFFGCAVCCFASSTLMHLFYYVSPRVCRTLLFLDYAGILLLIAGTCVVGIYLQYFCSPALRTLFVCTAVGGPLVGGPLLLNVWNKSPSSLFILFVSCAVLAMAPVFLVEWTAFTDWFVHGLFAYSVGGLFFATCFPECLFPGRLDYTMHSHALMHVCVVIGAGYHCFGLLELFLQKDAQHCE